MTPLQRILKIRYVEALRQDQWEYIKTLLEGIEEATTHPPLGKRKWFSRIGQATQEETSPESVSDGACTKTLLEHQISRPGNGLETIATLECHRPHSPVLLDTANPFYAIPHTADVVQCVAMLPPGIYGVASNDTGQVLFQAPRYMARKTREVQSWDCDPVVRLEML